MKKINKLIFVGLLLLSALAFAQADSCNMTLLDEWEIPIVTRASFTKAPFTILDNYIYAAALDSLYILEIDSTEELLHQNTLACQASQIAYKDSIIYASRNAMIRIINIATDTLYPEIIDSITTPFMSNLLICDTVMFAYELTPSRIMSINIAQATEPINSIYANYSNNIEYHGPFSDGNYLYVCGDQQYGDHPEEWYSKAVLEVYDPYSFADSIAFMGRYFFGGDTIGHWHKAYFVDFRQDSFMILGDYPNVFSIWKTNSTRNSFELVTEEADTNFYPSHIEYIGDSIAVILGDNQVFLYDFSSFPDYSLLGSYTFDEGGLYSILVNYPYFVVLYQVFHPTTPYPVYLKLLKYTPSSGMNCSYNAKEENDFQIFPNPFNSSCSIELANNTQSIEITDIRGTTIKSIENPTTFNWQPKNLPSGLYFITVDFGETKVTKKAVLLR